ncbi:MAG TPA: hypothetical protein VMU51_01125 [Mycobacteriales bacterium]|nr:hypothetical protein [Mycobacteriales bacterium]
MDEQHDDGARLLRAELDRLVAAPPPVGFTGADAVLAGRRRRRTRLTGAGVTAIGAVVAILLPVLVFGRSPATGPQPTGSGVPGYSQADLQRLTRECAAKTYDLVPVGPSGTTRSRLRLADLRAYNVIKDALGTLVLIYGPNAVLSCGLDVGIPVALSFNHTHLFAKPGLPDWLPGPVALDYAAVGDGSLSRHVPAIGEYAGRVTSDVVRVRVEFGPDTATVPVVNGTYLVRFLNPVRSKPGPPMLPVRIRGYDAAGRLVGTAGDVLSKGCRLLPDGSLLGGGTRKPGERCTPALRWH